ncbi:MAG: HAD family hydrolase [Lachnospiraceae bacterium]
MIQADTVIFDMDGVIFDSEQIVLDSWRKVAEEFEIPNIEKTARKLIGLTYQAARDVFSKAYEGAYDFDELKPHTSKYYYAYVKKNGLPLKKGIRELLSYLRENGYRTAVASSTRIEVVKKEIADAGLTEYFDRLVGGDMLKRSKPAPDIFLMAAKQLQAQPKNCYVIEDSYNGIRAASAAGMIPLMVPDLLPKTEEMEQMAEGIFEDLLQVMRFLRTKKDAK